MSEFEVMSCRLQETGLYDIQEGTIVYAELKAYAAGLDMYFDILKEIADEHLVASANSYGLTMYSNIISAPNIDNTTDGIRESILSAMSVGYSDRRLSDYEKLLGIYNIHGTLSEENGNIIIHCTESPDSATKAFIEAHIARFAPVFSTITFE